MDKFETPYDEDVEFFECKACGKCLRGKTLYKIHLTTPAHVKKEAALFSKGHDLVQCSDFRDILHYLDYLKLDEPIIGLDYLEEKPCKDPQDGPSYKCGLCVMEASLEEMVRHVIGRKHRQKYMERKRPDLVTWGNQTVNSQGGKAIRAKAEIVERQNGRGKPIPLNKRNEINIGPSKVAPRMKQTGSRGIPEQTLKNVPPLIPGLKTSISEFSHQRNRYPEMSSFHSDEPNNMYRDRREEPLSRDYMREEPQREDYRERRMVRDDYINSDYHQYEGEYVEEPQRRMLHEPGNVPRYDRDEPPHGQRERAERYPEKPPTYEKPVQERDWLKEFYVEEMTRGSARPPPQPGYREGINKRSMERETRQRDTMTRGRIQESAEPNSTGRNYSTPEQSEQSREHLFSIIRDYQHKIREPHPEETSDNLGSNRQGDVTRMFSDMPEPFRRFLKGPADDEEQGKRKRKSRFSDATPEEQEMTNKTFRDDYGPPPPKFGGESRHVNAPVRPEINRGPYSHHDTQSPQHTESYQEGGNDSEGVFDMLKNIEIENAEEAYFLKNKLCSLLKEFKTKKMEKALKNSQSLASTSKGYNDPPLPRQHVLERPLGGDSDHRKPDLHFRDDARLDPQQWERRPDERDSDYHHLAQREPRQSNRSRYEDVFGSSQTSQVNEPPSYPERFQERVRPREYQPSVPEYFDSPSPARPLHMDQESRMNRNARYSSTLDKITSTLLELVARK